MIQTYQICTTNLPHNLSNSQGQDAGYVPVAQSSVSTARLLRPFAVNSGLRPETRK